MIIANQADDVRTVTQMPVGTLQPLRANLPTILGEKNDR